ncbi:bifunctional riboflavin kinase/FAD synthetase [Lutibaculum baratangense]|uniref:Riboflavin biosynthesis protein n=1 Tax=Lutibaculum baratangense AMV1 TaxID=631454 RepID=V4TP83_9HYPH|nr:bifunctional riboflavin kinase/FAD synthetase [Lutibaculum baratangense]ESR27493.1 Riboflavin kinase [Lutibaculum baratangense AMV1]
MPPLSIPVVSAVEDLPASLKCGVVAIGNFDGVHRGHRIVIDMAVSRARSAGLPALVMTFEPHPRAFFQPGTPMFRLTPAHVKARLLERAGVDGVLQLTFDRDLAALTAEEFVSRVLVEGIEAREVVVGYDFQFGKGRAGTPASLVEMGRSSGFGVDIVSAAGNAGTIFSSSAVRARLAEGDVEGAADILGYRWFVIGEVVHGGKRGRDLGFPTANVDLGEGCGLRHGIYAVRMKAEGEWHDGVASYGRRPQFDDGAPLLETYLFDFSGDLYGKEVTVELFDFIRPEQRFESVEALVEQMRRDEADARAHLADAVRREAPGP